MKPTRKSILARALAVAALAACFLSAPAPSSVAASNDAFTTWAGPRPEVAMIGQCEAALAGCMNGGGDTDRCWNAYWRCISR
jgi:hypothetical protein